MRINSDAIEDIGCRTIDGVSMFVYQGAFQLELCTGMEGTCRRHEEGGLTALGKGDG